MSDPAISKPTETRIGVIDGWRCISVFLVIISHLTYHSRLSELFPGPVVQALGKYATLGVLIFFVISGYVICRGFVHEEVRSATISIRGFYIRRCLRILPPLALYTVVVLILGAAGAIDVHPAQATCVLFFACNLDVGLPETGYFFGHIWSLAYEEQFYLLFPILFWALLPRKNFRTFWVAIYALLTTTSFVLYLLKHPLLAGYLQTFCYLLAGVLAALYERWLIKVLAPHASLVLLASLTLLVIIPQFSPSHYAAPFWLALGPSMIVCLLFCTTFAETPVSGVLRSRPFTAIGQVSYSVYLWQQLATAYFHGAGAYTYLATVVAAICWAGLLWRVMERPLIRLGKDLSRRTDSRDQPESTRST